MMALGPYLFLVFLALVTPWLVACGIQAAVWQKRLEKRREEDRRLKEFTRRFRGTALRFYQTLKAAGIVR